MMEDKQIGVPTNVAVFIDYENVYKALLEEKTNVLRLAFFEKYARAFMPGLFSLILSFLRKKTKVLCHT